MGLRPRLLGRAGGGPGAGRVFADRLRALFEDVVATDNAGRLPERIEPQHQRDGVWPVKARKSVARDADAATDRDCDLDLLDFAAREEVATEHRAIERHRRAVHHLLCCQLEELGHACCARWCQHG